MPQLFSSQTPAKALTKGPVPITIAFDHRASYAPKSDMKHNYFNINNRLSNIQETNERNKTPTQIRKRFLDELIKKPKANQLMLEGRAPSRTPIKLNPLAEPDPEDEKPS